MTSCCGICGKAIGDDNICFVHNRCLEPSAPISFLQKLLEEEWNGTSDADYRWKADTLKEAIERFCKEKEKAKEQQ